MAVQKMAVAGTKVTHESMRSRFSRMVKSGELSFRQAYIDGKLTNIYAQTTGVSA